MSLDNTPNPAPHETISEISVTEVSVETHGAMPRVSDPKPGGALSKIALGLGLVSLALTPIFGIGVFPAILGIVMGHIAKRGDALGQIRAMVGLGLSYVALVVGTIILVFVVTPIVLAFLVSAGYILAD
ncbi:MAG: hypothetical protein ABR66_05765 [Microbacteriaceae bacterium BACL25 MAG-120322-bin65]|jgi:hypothetical protein|nr:MAG: hypothetical protein ABR66_05765 [Microbacteriaceae bacterium BACL25 MAG-120322-bin65]HAA79268.1 hypothetical protein [Microbacteriaceae bacterium]